MKLLKSTSSCAAAVSLLLSGCAINVNDEIQNTEKAAKDLSITESYGSNYSVPMQMMYLYTQEKPIKENNLDKFNFNADYSAANNALMAGSIATSLLGGADGLSTLFGASSVAVNDKRLNVDYGLNQFIYFEPVKGSIQESRKNAQRKITEILKKGYEDAGLSVTVLDNISDKNEGRDYPPIGYTFDKVSNVVRPSPNPDCPFELSENGQEYRTILSAEVCQAGAPAYGQLVTNNDGVFPFAPTGKFIMFMRQLPSNYPIKHLKTNDDYAYLYQPSMLWMAKQSYWLKDVPKSRIIEMYNAQQLTYNPLVKKLSTGEFMYFNSEVSSRQASPTTRATEIKVSK